MEATEVEKLAKEKLMAELFLLKSQLEEKNTGPMPAKTVRKSAKIKVISKRKPYLVSRVVVKKKTTGRK